MDAGAQMCIRDRVFEEGSDPSLSVRFSMDAYLENCAGYARTMAEEFRLRVDSEDENAARALELADIAGGDGDIDERYAAYAEPVSYTHLVRGEKRLLLPVIAFALQILHRAENPPPHEICSFIISPLRRFVKPERAI